MLPAFERRNHGSGVWFPDEIMDALSAVNTANLDVAQHIDTPEMRLYRSGFEAAIGALAQAFGLTYYSPAVYGPSAHVIAPVQLERR